MSHRNSLQYVRDEWQWHREQARGGSLWATAAGWAYQGPILLLVLLWWLVTRIVGVPLGILRWTWRRIKR